MTAPRFTQATPRGRAWAPEPRPSRWGQRLKVAIGTLALLATCINDVRW